jgi:hypothetical protein
MVAQGEPAAAAQEAMLALVVLAVYLHLGLILDLLVLLEQVEPAAQVPAPAAANILGAAAAEALEYSVKAQTVPVAPVILITVADLVLADLVEPTAPLALVQVEVVMVVYTVEVVVRVALHKLRAQVATEQFASYGVQAALFHQLIQVMYNKTLYTNNTLY